MALVADILLVAGALGAGFYCMILARRLRRFNDLEGGMGGAIATLSVQVDDLTRAQAAVRRAAEQSTTHLTEQTERAEAVVHQLELLMASLHDLELRPEAPAPAPMAEPPGAPPVDPDGPVPFLRSGPRAPAAKAPPLVLRNRPEQVR